MSKCIYDSNDIPFLDSKLFSTWKRKIKSLSFNLRDIPDEIRNSSPIIDAEKDKGLRRQYKRGFDVIQNMFFVEETISSPQDYREGKESSLMEILWFKTFDDYYQYLDGNIYKQSSYYQYSFTDEQIRKYGLKIKKINYNSFIDFTIDSCKYEPGVEEVEDYKLKENTKKEAVKVLNRFTVCKSSKDFENVFHYALKTFKNFDIDFWVYNCVQRNKNFSFDFVMKFINDSNGKKELATAMVFYFDYHKICDKYGLTYWASECTYQRHKSQIKKLGVALQEHTIKTKCKYYFDQKTHFYVCYIQFVDDKGLTLGRLPIYFETFGELTKETDYDISCFDLFYADIDLGDLSKYTIGNDTVLPKKYYKPTTKLITSEYDPDLEAFNVKISYRNEKQELRSYHFDFKYFVDFVYFMKGDLFSTHLLFCDGLKNVADFSQISFNSESLVDSSVLNKLGIHPADAPKLIGDNESALILKNEDDIKYDLVKVNERYFDKDSEIPIFYVSDLHLINRIYNNDCKTNADAFLVLEKIAKNIVDKINASQCMNRDPSILLISGDTAYDLGLFSLFVSLLKKRIKSTGRFLVFFVLGNHEIWFTPTNGIENIVEEYREIIERNGMYLLQNQLATILFNRTNYKVDVEIYDEGQIFSMPNEELQSKIMLSNVAILGGTGFAGFNDEFNAEKGFIYREALTREREIKESNNFSALHNRLVEIVPNKNVIVMTHFPKIDWSGNRNYQPGYYYVSGHTHKNEFFDDGFTKIYADNQVGYKAKNVQIKHFVLNKSFDKFYNLTDGIHEITADDFIEFYQGLNKDVKIGTLKNRVFLLKRNGISMFIHQGMNSKLCILNGGAMKALPTDDINYFYDNMLLIADKIKEPIFQFNKILNKVSIFVKNIGGDGTIHGCIVDIDFNDHIYVNPTDYTISCYYATDIVNKLVYPNLLSLVKERCKALLGKEGKNLHAITNFEKEHASTALAKSEWYFDTYMYKSSSIILKMQKIESNLLCIWLDPEINIKIEHNQSKQTVNEVQEQKLIGLSKKSKQP